MIWSESFPHYPNRHSYDFRIRQKIRDGDDEYVVTGDSWPAFLFPHGKADPDNIEKGMFRSALLLKVTKHHFLITSSD